LERSAASVTALSINIAGDPIEDSLFPDVEEANQHEAKVDDHLPKAEKARSASDLGEIAVDHRPGKHENSLYIEEDEEHGNHVEADGKASAGVASRLDAALIGGQLDRTPAALPDES